MLSSLYGLAGPALRMLNPETAHGLAIAALARGLAPRPEPFEDPVLKVQLWNLHFPNPLGVAAGFDKDARVADAVLAQGFGFTEVGSVTPQPQPGNPRPRVFRLPRDGAVINRLGFNSEGHQAVVRRLAARRSRGIVGVNLGANKDSRDEIADYVAGVQAMVALAGYLVVNVSSPNTPGLRALQGREQLTALLDAVLAARAASGARTPVLLKIAPDLSDEDKRDIAEVTLSTGIDGLVATNTTIDRPAGLSGRHAGEKGGLSGRPLMDLSTRVLADMYKLTRGRVPLIGVGGVASGADAYAKIRAGASLVQLYTALIYSGPGLIGDIKKDLVARLKADGFASVADAVGADVS